MFERFDDEQVFHPDDHFRAGVMRRGRVLRRRRQMLLSGGAVLATTVGLVSGIGLYVERRDDAIDRVDVVTQPSTDGAVNVLLVGSDATPGIDGARADTVMLLRIDDAGSRLLSIPRDLHDPDATHSRLNQALTGGPQTLIDAVQRLTGVPVDHYVELDLDGFVDLVDASGGLRVRVSAAIRDEGAGLELEPSDCATLDGDTALALVRSRQLEARLPDGTWLPDTTGDLGRIARQQAVLAAALEGVERNPATIDRLSRVLADHAVVDDGLDLAALIDLGTRLAAAPTVTIDVLPVRAVDLASGARALELASGAAELLASYGGVPLPNRFMPYSPSAGIVPVEAC